MTHCRSLALSACALMLLTLAACSDDPSGVGLGVTPRGFDGGTPQVVNLTPTSFSAESIDDITGNSARILTGTVNDPLLGTIEAAGYIDVTPPVTLPDGFTDGTVSDAELVLTPEGSGNNISVPPYVYGDTLTSMTLGVYEMPDEWDATTSDEMPSAGPLIAESEPFTPGDTVRIDLSGWNGSSSLNDTTDFADTFHGFQLRATSGNAVVGFAIAGASSSLRITVGDNTEDYDGTQSFSSVRRTTAPSTTDRVVIQDGIGQALSFTFTLPDSIRNAPISRAELHLPTDTTVFDADRLPNGFVRPLTSELLVQGFADDGTGVLANTNTLNEQGAFTISGAALREVFQQELIGNLSVDRYRVTLSQADNTINPLLFYALDTSENAPRVSLTITPSGD